jgi:transposase
MLYHSNQQLLPFDRLRQLCRNLFGQSLSAATLAAINARAGKALAPVEEAIIKAITQSPAVHADESGLRVEGKTPLASCRLHEIAHLLRRAWQPWR